MYCNNMCNFPVAGQRTGVDRLVEQITKRCIRIPLRYEAIINQDQETCGCLGFSNDFPPFITLHKTEICGIDTLRYGKQLQIIFLACRSKVRSFLLILKHIFYPGRSSALNGVILWCYCLITHNYPMPRKEVIIIKVFIFTFNGFTAVITHAECWENTRKA